MSDPWETSDEDAIDNAVSEMFDMAGNAGQESILENGMGAFTSWAEGALEGLAPVSYEYYLGQIIGVIGLSAYYGTSEIWNYGYELMADQSVRHDDKGDKIAGIVFSGTAVDELVDAFFDLF